MPPLLSAVLGAEQLACDDDGNLTDVYLPGDVDRDGDVDESDMGALLASWGKCEGEQGYNPNADFNGDGCVNQSDFAILLARWGTTNTSLQIRYTWDAENRLVGVEPVFPDSSGDTKVEFTYDYLGRQRPSDLPMLMRNVRSYLWSTQRQPEIVQSYFHHECVTYAAM